MWYQIEDDERYPGMYIDDEEWEREMGRTTKVLRDLEINK